MVDVSLRHDFIGAGRDGCRTHGKLRKPDNPDRILEDATAQQIRDYRTTYRRSCQVASCRHAFLPRAASTVNSCAYSSSLQTRRPTNISRHSDISRQARVLSSSQRLLPAKLVHQRDGICSCRGDRASLRRGTSPTCRPSTWPTTSMMTAMSATSSARRRLDMVVLLYATRVRAMTLICRYM